MVGSKPGGAHGRTRGERIFDTVYISVLIIGFVALIVLVLIDFLL